MNIIILVSGAIAMGIIQMDGRRRPGARQVRAHLTLTDMTVQTTWRIGGKMGYFFYFL